MASIGTLNEDLNTSLITSTPSSQDEDDLDAIQVNSFAEDTTTQENKEKSAFKEVAVLFALTINYIFGAGVLSLPHQVAHGGIVVSAITLIISSTICLAGMTWVLEIQERAKVLKGYSLTNMSVSIEYAELCKIFLGNHARKLYEISLIIFVICSSWLYAAIFSVSMSETLPLFSNSSQCDLSNHNGFLWTYEYNKCWADYIIYLLGFTVVMIALVRTDIANMGGLQLILTGLGLTAIVTMIITLIFAIPEDGIAPIENSTLYFNASSFGNVFGTFVFAQVSHHGIPLLSTQVARKKLIKPVFTSVIITTTLLYLILGILCALFFGIKDLDDRHEINNLITLDWQDYTAGKLKAGVFADIISYFVRIYPAITVSAAFPLYAITLGNSLHLMHFQSSSNTRAALEYKNMFYTIAMMPSIFCAAFMANTSFMLFFVGIAAFIIAFFLPPLMQLSSIKMVVGAEKTSYTSFFSKPICCYFCLGFATVALLYTLYSNFFQ